MATALAACSQHTFAQYDDAASLSARCLNFVNADPVLGTASYSAMAGANLAAGQNISSLKENPAGTAMYTREADFSLTPLWNTRDGEHRLKMASGGAAFVVDNRHKAVGYTASTLAFAYHTLNDYDNKLEENGKSFYQHGKSGQWSASYGANFGNRQFVGIGINFITGKIFEETDVAPHYPLNLKSSLTGFSATAGAVFNLREDMNIALALQSPARINVEENNKINRDATTLSKPYTSLEYHITAPMKASAGFASRINHYTRFDVDYSFQNFSSLKVANSYDVYSDARAFAKECLLPTHTFKVGLEATPTDELKCRLGFAYRTSPTERPTEKFLGQLATDFTFPAQNTYPALLAHESFYLCTGAGYTFKAFYIDLAYVFKRQDYSFYPHADGTNSYQETTQNTHNVLLTLGVRP